MNAFLDDTLVGLILAAGFGYAVYSLGPKAIRLRMCKGAAAMLGAVPGMRRVAGRLAATAAAKSGSACGGCDSCESGASTPPSNGPAAEIHIPLSTIGKRRRDAASADQRLP
jgi:hypothetical protein